jgi:hypothetical protein
MLEPVRLSKMTTRDLCFSLLLCSAVLGFPGCGSTNNQGAQGGSRAGGTSGSTVGGGGGSAVGGGGGSSGGGAGGTTVASCISIADDLIADFTTDNGLSQVDGREGGFYVYGDGSLAGTFYPPIPSDPNTPYPIDTTTGNPNCSGAGSFHVKASGWGVWGAALGADFMPKDGAFKGTYDASKYRGVSFWAKASAPLTRVQVSFPDVYTDAAASFAGLPVPDGTDPSFTSCLYIPDPKYNCSPYLVKFGADPQYFPAYQDYQIDTTWKRFDVFFADTRQDQYNLGFHGAVDPTTGAADLNASNLDVSHLTAMAIQVNANYVNNLPTPNDFEIWVDDVNFIK